MPHAAIRIVALLAIALVPAALAVAQEGYTVVDTDQVTCYDNVAEIPCPQPGQPFHGQDAQFPGHAPAYVLGADGLTVHDARTGLTWQRSPDIDGDGDIDADDKLTWVELQGYPAVLNAIEFGGYGDWRLPTIKELYSLIDFGGIDPSGWEGDPSGLVPFLDTDYFDFAYGDVDAGERIIDAQYWSATEYVGLTGPGDATVFGVNFADGRIKGYPRDTGPGGQPFTEFVRCVRSDAGYGTNDFVDNGDGTVTDLATGLMWTKDDSGAGLDWEQALAFAETLVLAGHDDWRLPDAKELQSLVDYARSPSTTGSAAIDPVFHCTAILDEGGATNYAFYWASTSHVNWTESPGAWGVYVAFGEALGWMQLPPPAPPGTWVLWDVHGAGAQRSDPKSGDPGAYPHGHGPQGDVVRIENLVRCVRDATASADACRDGTVNLGVASDPATVLDVNGSAGDEDHVVTVAFGDPIDVTMEAPPAGPEPAPFALYVWIGEPDETTVTPQPKNLGAMCFPTPLSGGLPQPKKIWNNLGRVDRLGNPDYPSTPAPSTVLHLPTGLDVAIAVTFQGFILDDGSASSKPASVTNAMLLRIAGP